MNLTSENGTVYTISVTNTTYFTAELPLIYFPHLIAAVIMVLISVGGYLKSKEHIIISNIILLIGPIELIAYAA